VKSEEAEAPEATLADDILEEESETDMMNEDDKASVPDEVMSMTMSPMRHSTLQEIPALTTSLGGSRSKNQAGLGRRYRAVVSEVYSPPRAAQAAAILSDLDIDPGLSLDITTCDEFGTPWDFNKKAMRANARRRFDEQEPELLVGSPMCTAYSAWQRISRVRSPIEYKKKLKEARVHLKFVRELYELQMGRGKLFLHEHPEQAGSWEEACIQKMLGMLGVSTTVLDQCQLGQRSSDGQPLKKPTHWMSNSEDILEHLDRRRSGKGGLCSATSRPHTTCSGKTAKEVAIYPFQLCEAILRGLRQHLDKCDRVKASINVILLEGAKDESHEQECALILALIKCNPGCIYDATIGQMGQMLKRELVALARQEGMEHFRSK